jgi:sulfur relay protein TusB/DsrH
MRSGSAAVTDINNPGCLHLLMSPQISTLNACLSHCLPGDSVVLVNNAVSLLLQEELWETQAGPLDVETLTISSPEICLFALEADVLARGIPTKLVAGNHAPRYALIDDVAWAELLIKHSHCLSWK